METISDWLLKTIRKDETSGIMNGWIEEVRFEILPQMSRTIEHLLGGGSLILLNDEQRSWFGEYVTTHINQPHKGRAFFPIIQIKHLTDMIDSHAKEGSMRGFEPIYNMLDMMYPNYKFWYVGKKNARADFARGKNEGWHWIFDELQYCGLKSTDEHLDYKLINLFKLFEQAIVNAMLQKISLDI